MVACSQKGTDTNAHVIANGNMPNLARDAAGIIHMVYGYGDSLLYSYSADEGTRFSSPELIGLVHGLTAGAMRGPQIACNNLGPVVTANNHAGDIFCFRLGSDHRWTASGKVNDIDTVARENLMALAADHELSYAVWLDLREGHNCIYGSSSTDGGVSWSKNKLIYASPDSTVCECCKPSVIVKENKIYVMFRNWLGGNRDLYLIESRDGGLSFGNAVKLGLGSWSLNGCPMDGGALSLDSKGSVQTVWNRKGRIYGCVPGEPEFELGQGRHCTIETTEKNNVYAWVENKHVIILNSKNKKLDLGPGDLPLLKSIGRGRILCIWGNEENIYSQILNI